MAEYVRVKRITVPLEDNDHLLLVTTGVNADHNRTIEHLLKLVSPLKWLHLTMINEEISTMEPIRISYIPNDIIH
jgi:hypothetical protein